MVWRSYGVLLAIWIVNNFRFTAWALAVVSCELKVEMDVHENERHLGGADALGCLCRFDGRCFFVGVGYWMGGDARPPEGCRSRMRRSAAERMSSTICRSAASPCCSMKLSAALIP